MKGKTEPNVELIKVTLRLRKSDNDYITEMAAATRGDVSYNSIIREIVHDYVVKLRAQERAIRDARNPIDTKSATEAELIDMEIAL